MTLINLRDLCTLDVDLADLSNLSFDNGCVKYFLIDINVFTRRLWVEPMINQTPDTVVKSFKKIFSHAELPNMRRSDKDLEFYNRNVKTYLEVRGITYITLTHVPPTVASIVIFWKHIPTVS